MKATRLILVIAILISMITAMTTGPARCEELPETELKKLDAPGYFKEVKTVKELPEAVRKLYPEMADPGKPFNSGCVRTDGLPGMAMTFAMQSKDRLWICTEQGGIALVPQVVLYDISQKTPALIWKVTRPMHVGNKEALKKAITGKKS